MLFLWMMTKTYSQIGITPQTIQIKYYDISVNLTCFSMGFSVKGRGLFFTEIVNKFLKSNYHILSKDLKENYF